MPSIYYQRNFQPNCFYHVYNRGAHKQNIFLTKQDYSTYISILRYYLDYPTGQPISYLNRFKVPNLDILPQHKPVEIICYCLMPNHFHLLLRQTDYANLKTNISNFMRRTSITYALYFQNTHSHSGAIFQGKYKNILIDSDPYLLHLNRYIHLNPLDLPSIKSPQNYPYSSYQQYLHPQKKTWINSSPILKFFQHSTQIPQIKHSNYQAFIEDTHIDSTSILNNLTLE